MEMSTGLALLSSYGRPSGTPTHRGGPPDAGQRGAPLAEDNRNQAHGRLGRGPGHTPVAALARTSVEQPPVPDGLADRGYTLQATSLSYQRSERTEIQIRTQEGDLVSLKFRSRDASELEASRAHAGGTAVSELSVSGRSRTHIAVSVEGELSDGELRAIQDVVEQAGALADDFYADGTDAAFNTLDSLQVDARHLARVKVDLSLRESFTYAELGLRSMPPPAAAPAAGAMTEPDVAAHADAAPEAAPPSATAETTRPGVEPAASALGAVSGFLNRMLDLFADDHKPSGDSTQKAEAQLDLRLKLKIFESVLVAGASSQQESEAREAPQLLLSTLETMAADRQEPVSTVA